MTISNDRLLKQECNLEHGDGPVVGAFDFDSGNHSSNPGPYSVGRGSGSAHLRKVDVTTGNSRLLKMHRELNAELE